MREIRAGLAVYIVSLARACRCARSSALLRLPNVTACFRMDSSHHAMRSQGAHAALISCPATRDKQKWVVPSKRASGTNSLSIPTLSHTIR
jgi:hypothetical protein